MHRHFAVCIVAFSLVISVAAQEQPVTGATTRVVAAASSPFSGTTAIQVDAKGVDFNPWLRTFVSRVRRNWFVPVSASDLHGSVIVTFVVHRDGKITDVVTSTPSDVETFNRAAFNAVIASSPVEALPVAYPDASAKFT